MKNYKHQQDILEKNPDKRGLFLGTGSGKTRLASLLARSNTLVICPKTVRDAKTWEREWVNVGNDIDYLTVVSKEQFKKLWRDLPRYDTIIGDEAHTLAGVQPSEYQKNYKKFPKKSQIYEAVESYLEEHKPERIYMLTATPIPNPMVVYGLATLLGYKWSYPQFRDTFYFEKSRNIWLVKKTLKHKEKLATVVNHIGEVGRLQDWFDVPDQTYKTHTVEVTKGQNDCVMELQMLYPDPLVQLGKRHMLEQGIFEEVFLNENKTQAIDSYVQEFGKVVVFARYTKQIEHYAEVLGKKYEVLTLTGKTKHRQQLLEKANSLKEVVLIVQSQISAGWEIPEFPCMIFASESYSYIDREQAEGRILRANKLKKNLYVTLVAGEIDRRVRTTIDTKADFVEKMHAENICNQKKLI